MGARDLTPEEIKKVDAILKEAGFKKGGVVRISPLARSNYPYIIELEKISKAAGFRRQLSKLIVAAGWKSAHVKTTKDTLKNALMEAYPFAKVKRFAEGRGSVMSLTDFQNTHQREYFTHYRRYKSGEFPPVWEVMNSLYEEFPNLYSLISRRVNSKSTDIRGLSKSLKNVFYSGGDMSVSGLRSDKSTAHLFNKVCTVVDNLRKQGRTETSTEVIAQLTGIEKSEFTTGGGKNSVKIGSLSELITRFLISGTRAVDHNAEFQTEKFRQTFPTPIMGISKGVLNVYSEPSESSEFFVSDVVVFSDKSSAVEVKNHRQYIKHRKEKIVRQLGSKKRMYAKQNGKFKSIDSRVVVLHGTDPFIEKMTSELSGNGIKLFTAKDFEESLEALIKNSERKITFPFPPEEMMEIYRNIAYFPHMLIKKSQFEKRRYALEILKSLNKSLAGESQTEMHPVSVFGKKGSERKNKRGKFQYFRLKLSDLEQTAITKYVMRNLSVLEKSKLLFLDFETMGFEKTSHLICGGYASVHDKDYEIEIAFARNPFEESAITKDAVNRVENAGVVVTYNGWSYDTKQIQRRSTANLVRCRPYTHMDVYQHGIRTVRQKLGLATARLKEIDNLFGVKRKDIPGREIPKLYTDYLYEGEDISPALEHNAFDMVSLAAAYIKCVKELKIDFKPHTKRCEHKLPDFKYKVPKREQIKLF
ncbi:ribonuclease H-like domain-containing protein [Candidatus Woesearchaeota archaeon]|nr:ribonuclease H-like domain-containing protein [Candidatus Woesearchaeota archaeon]